MDLLQDTNDIYMLGSIIAAPIFLTPFLPMSLPSVEKEFGSNTKKCINLCIILYNTIAMSDDNLSIKAREALRHLRNFIMHNGRTPSIRELMRDMNYKSPLSAMLLLNELAANEFIEKKPDGSYRLIKDLSEGEIARTVSVPLVGTVTCGRPMLAEENIEALIPVSVSLAKPGSKYFLLKAVGDSMDEAGIDNGDLILVRQQPTADNGDKIVALIDDEATVKEFRRSGNIITLVPRSSNLKHKPIILSSDFRIQGLVMAVIPKKNQ